MTTHQRGQKAARLGERKMKWRTFICSDCSHAGFHEATCPNHFRNVWKAKQ